MLKKITIAILSIELAYIISELIVMANEYFQYICWYE